MTVIQMIRKRREREIFHSTASLESNRNSSSGGVNKRHHVLSRVKWEINKIMDGSDG